MVTEPIYSEAHDSDECPMKRDRIHYVTDSTASVRRNLSVCTHWAVDFPFTAWVMIFLLLGR